MSGSLPGYRLLVFDVCSEHQDLLLEKWLPTTPEATHYFPGSVTADEVSFPQRNWWVGIQEEYSYYLPPFSQDQFQCLELDIF